MMKKNKLSLILMGLFLLTSCAPVRDTHERLNGVLWAQTSAEYVVTYHSAFNQARRSIIKGLSNKQWNAVIGARINEVAAKNPAIIVDIDETILDNSNFQGQLVLNREGFNKDLWHEWVRMHSAKSTPGAVQFLQWVAGKGISIYYITNRSLDSEAYTIKNLIKDHFPNVNANSVLSKGDVDDSSDKTGRRRYVVNKHRVILLLGDDINDFLWTGGSSPEERKRIALKYKDNWGNKWILLPNTLYGSWESSLYGNNYAISEKEVLIKKMSVVKGMEEKTRTPTTKN